MKITNNTLKNDMWYDNNTSNFEPIDAMCEECLSEFTIESKDDIEELNGSYGWSGGLSITCPCCGERTNVDHYIELNKNNIEYPKHFKMENGVTPVHIEDSEVQDKIRKLIGQLDNPLNDELDYIYTAYGDLFILVTKEDDGYYVVVTRDYDDCYV